MAHTARADSQLTLDRFYSLAPNKPYCSDDLGYGLKIRPKKTAFKHNYIQHNPPSMRHWMTFDLDHEKFMIWEDAGLPDPNLVVRNKQNRRCHASYAVESVCTSEAAKPKPLQYMAAIESAFCEELQADRYYTGLITKNPCSDEWSSIEIHNHVFSLGELADYVDLKPHYWTRKRAANDTHYGVGRNCALFHRLRFWAYDNVMYYREDGSTYEQWMRDVLSRCEAFNDFHEALPYGEIKSTAKSVGKWVWVKYWPDGRPVRRGVMADSFNQTQIPLDLKRKQRLSARRTHEVRKSATEEKIIDAIGQLIAAGKKPSKAAVSRLTGVSRQQISTRYSNLFLN